MRVFLSAVFHGIEFEFVGGFVVEFKHDTGNSHGIWKLCCL